MNGDERTASTEAAPDLRGQSHAPGPWRVEPHGEYEGLHTIWSGYAGELILVARTCLKPSSASNASLIAAAPEMHEALLDCIAALEETRCAGEEVMHPPGDQSYSEPVCAVCGGPGGGGCFDDCSVKIALVAARAAIAKATGQ